MAHYKINPYVDHKLARYKINPYADHNIWSTKIKLQGATLSYINNSEC